MGMTPLMVNLKGRKVVCVGGGSVAERRIKGLLDSGAQICVIAPGITEKLCELSAEGKISWRKKAFEAEDIEEAFLIIAAASDPAVNEAVIKAAPAYALCNDASDANRGNVHIPSHLKQGRFSVSISTGGASPMLAAKVKRQLESQFDERFGEYVDFLHETRQLIKRSSLPPAQQKTLLSELLSEKYLLEHKQREFIADLKQILAEGKSC